MSMFYHNADAGDGGVVDGDDDDDDDDDDAWQ